MKQRLLIADWNFASATRYSAYFSDVGYWVDTAANGLDCLTTLRRAGADLLVLDQEILWGRGEGVLACLRGELQRDPIPVVLLAAILPAGALSQWLSPPVVRCFLKPFPIEVLHDSIESVLGCPRDTPAAHRPTRSGSAAR